jgi:hypothetical protein
LILTVISKLMGRLYKALLRFLSTGIKRIKPLFIPVSAPVEDKRAEPPVLLPVINSPGRYVFFCPGCKANHVIDTTPSKNRAYHVLTGTFANPTIRASVMSNPKNLPGRPRCHSFVTNGVIDYLNDCTHELSGKKVKLPPL